MAAKKQWHPVFAELLRLTVESHYRVETNVPVGDVPREADFVLLRRTRAGQLPAAGLWRDLTPWNVLEFKGPSVSPRDEDPELLVELGLGIHRRLNDDQARQQLPTQGPDGLSLWFLANRLGRRLLRGWGGRLGDLQPHGPGVWRGQVLGRTLFLVSGADLPVEEASLPLHLVTRESEETEEAVARLVTENAGLWERYGGWLAFLHPTIYEEVRSMARQRRGELTVDLNPIVELMGMRRVVEQLGLKRVVEEFGLPRVVDEVGAEHFVKKLTAAQRQVFKRLLED